MFRMGKLFGAASFVQILAPELNGRMLADFLDMESSLVVNLHIQSVDQTSAIRTIKRRGYVTGKRIASQRGFISPLIRNALSIAILFLELSA